MKTIWMALALPTRRYNKIRAGSYHLLTPTAAPVHFFRYPQLERFRTDLVRTCVCVFMCVWEWRDWKKAERERLGKEICGGWGSAAHHAQPKSRIGLAGGCRSVLPLRPRTRTAPASVSTMASSSTRATAQCPDAHRRIFPPEESAGRRKVGAEGGLLERHQGRIIPQIRINQLNEVAFPRQPGTSSFAQSGESLRQFWRERRAEGVREGMCVYRYSP